MAWFLYDKRDDFNFEIDNVPFLDGDVPRSPSCGVYILNKSENATPAFFAIYMQSYANKESK